MKHRFHILLLLMFFMLAPTSTFAEQKWPEEPMRIVFALGYPPFSWLDDMGQSEGILVDAAEQILHQRLGIPVELKIYPWKRAQQMVEFGEADAFITVPTTDRSKYTTIIQPPILPTEFRIFISATNPKRPEIEQAKTLAELKRIANISTGYLTGSGWHIEHLQEFPTVVTAAKLSEVLKMVEAQRLDIYIDSSQIVEYHLKVYGLKDKIISVGNVMDAPTWNLCIGKKSKYSAYAKRIATEIQKMFVNGEIVQITKSITVKYTDKSSGDQTLKNEEHKL